MTSLSRADLASQAWSLQRKGDPERGKLYLETLLHSSPNDVQGRILLSSTLVDLGDLEGAVRIARHAHSLNLQPAQSTVSLATALGRLARLPHLTDSVKKEHRSEAIRLLQQQAGLIKPGGTSESLQALVLYNLAVLLAEAGQVDEALVTAGKALEVSASENQEVAVSVVELDAGDGRQQEVLRHQLVTLCLVLLGMIMSSRREFQVALRVLTAAPVASGLVSGASIPVDAASAAPFEVMSTSAAITSAGGAPLHTGEVLIARLRAKLLAGDGGGGDIQGAMSVLALLKKHMAAASATDGASSAGVTEMRAQVWQELALLCASSGDDTNALFCSDQALQLCPWQARSHQVQGQVHEAAGRATAAMEGYNTALALEPCHAPTLISLGTLYRRHGTAADLALAHDLLSDGLRYDPTSTAAWLQLGLTCRGLGHREEAERNLRTAVAMVGSEPALPFSDCPLVTRLLPSVTF